MFVSPAYAQGAGGAFGGIEPLIPLILIFVVFYFLLIRPQQKKAKAHREMLGQLRRGDNVVTSGGLIGKITRVQSDTELQMEIADGVRVRVARAMVQDVLAKTEPSRSSKAARDDDDEEDDDETSAPEGGAQKGRRRKSRPAKDSEPAQPSGEDG